jgi:hypothetical protein
MDKKRWQVPEERGYDLAYELTYKLGKEKLTAITDIEGQCRRSGAQCQISNGKKLVSIRYLSQPYLISLPVVDISHLDSQEQVPLRDKLLILHYFISATGTPPTNKLITFREVPEGNVYFPTFTQRTITPLMSNFSQNPERLLEIAPKVGGRKADYGDTAVTIEAFPRVPITIILWHGDAELAPQGNIVFDATIPDYLPTEDIVVLCETIIWKLIKILKSA